MPARPFHGRVSGSFCLRLPLENDSAPAAGDDDDDDEIDKIDEIDDDNELTMIMKLMTMMMMMMICLASVCLPVVP